MSTPNELGFSAPPEWEPHAATWTSWPYDDELWEGELSGVRDDVAAFVAALGRFEPVVLNVVDEETESDARARLAEAGAESGAIRFRSAPYDDIWFRDSGPIFVRDPAGRVAVTDWDFNGWGGKFAHARDRLAPRGVAAELGALRFEIPIIMEGGALEWNGRGVCLTTRSCLLDQRRNPDLGEAENERLLSANLGLRHVIWLEGALEGDHTDGHIDTLARFCDDRTIVCLVAEDERDPNHAFLERNRTLLQTLRDEDGEPYRIVSVPQPAERMTFAGRRLAPSYVNFYIADGAVLVPQYGDPNDTVALETLRPLFPGRETIGLPSRHLITGGGSFHCITQQQPAGEIAGG